MSVPFFSVFRGAFTDLAAVFSAREDQRCEACDGPGFEEDDSED